MQRKQQIKKNMSKTKKAKAPDTMAKLIPSFPGQVVKEFKMEALPVIQTTSAGGALASIYEIKASNVTNFTSRFGSLFEEYRIVKAKFTFRGYSSTTSGLFIHWIDEKDASAPTLAESKAKAAAAFAPADQRPHVLVWRARDPLDLQYIDCGTTTTTLATYKIYSETTTYGTTNSTTYGCVFAEFWVQFRGYA